MKSVILSRYVLFSFQLCTGALQTDFELDAFLAGEGGGTFDLDREKLGDCSCHAEFRHKNMCV